MRTFGVEEELMVVAGVALRPLSLGDAIVERVHAPRRGVRVAASGQDGVPARLVSGHQLTTELQREQVEVDGPPQTSLVGQLAAITRGRRIADEAARELGGRVVAMGTSVWPQLPHLVQGVRNMVIGRRFGLLAAEQLTCGFHVHVAVESREEGVQVLDRIRVWLPVLLAMSANSPFWYGRDSRFASYRYAAWSRWPTAGPTEMFGSVEEYDRRTDALVRSGAALDDAMIYYDARLSPRYPTVEVRVTDVCMDPRHAAVIAAVIRALVETAAREWRTGVRPPDVCAAELRARSWPAAKEGLGALLVMPLTGDRAPAGDVVEALLAHVLPVLQEYGEDDDVRMVASEMLRDGTGARHQREAYLFRNDPRDAVKAALRYTHRQLCEPVSAADGESRPIRSTRRIPRPGLSSAAERPGPVVGVPGA